MDFSNITTFNGLIQLCEQFSLLGNGGISNSPTLLAQFTNYLNIADNIAWSQIMSVDRNDKADDFNYTNVPVATITMFVNQSDYTLPVASVGANANTFLRLNGIYFLYQGSRIYIPKQGAGDVFTTIAAEPTFYKTNGKSIFFNCPLSATTLTKYSSVFYVEFQRIPSFFASTDTTKQAGFMATYHYILALKASSLYLLPINPALAREYSSGKWQLGRYGRPAEFEESVLFLMRDYVLRDDNTAMRLTANVQSNK